ncbi:MAG: helix-turn-helix transcriptional regulator [Lachnospiraceae bacterium]|nr:helix-turn-helix transcriptional regulator [Lachnospiraceae bacterium]
MARNNLKEARLKAGMTQKEVAEYLGITTKGQAVTGNKINFHHIINIITRKAVWHGIYR